MKLDWKDFDYNNPPEAGVYWIVVQEHCYDIDIDNYGHANGVPTGEVRNFVSLVDLEARSYDEWDGREEYDIAARSLLGYCVSIDYSTDSIIVKYAEVEVPSVPDVV